MKIIRPLAYVFLLGLLFSACASVRVSYDYDKAIDFSRYKTFDFHQKGLEKLDMNDLDKRRIVEAIKQNLEMKGLKETDTNPDLHINILSFTKEKINVNVYPYSGAYWHAWYSPWWGAWNSSHVTQYTEGTLIIDLVDAQKNILIWQGKGGGIDLDNLEDKNERIKVVVKAILSKYPPQIKKK